MTSFRFFSARIARAALAPALALTGAGVFASSDPALAAAALAAAVPDSAPLRAASTDATPRKLFAAPIAGSRLGSSRGGNASSDTLGEVRNTTAVNVAGGANSVRDGSFANAAGLTTVIQNSGSNVLIQNSTTVNIQFRP